MFRRTRTPLIRFTLFLFCTALLPAQQNTAPASIHLDVVVSPNSGPPVADLQPADFTLLDNKAPQRITSFHPAGGPQDSIHVILVVDAVNVPYTSIAYQRGQIAKFLRLNGGQLAHPTQIAYFTDQGIEAPQGYATDGNELNTSLSQHLIGLRTIHRSSQFQLSDRLNLSIGALRSLVQREAALPGRKIILWMSPGWPLLSGPGVDLDYKQQQGIFATVVDLSTRLREGRITLYAVDPIGAQEGVGRSFYYENFLKGVSKPQQVALGDLSLQVLAVQSGGLALHGSNDLTGMLQQCMADTRAYYQISFTPRAADQHDPYHQIDVRLSKPGLTARTMQGYYAATK